VERMRVVVEVGMERGKRWFTKGGGAATFCLRSYEVEAGRSLNLVRALDGGGGTRAQRIGNSPCETAQQASVDRCGIMISSSKK
jgi:hypothetical protein